VSRELSLRQDLLDAQIVDCEELPVGRVVDLELDLPEERGSAAIVALLTGTEALGQRLGGHLGRWVERGSARLRPPNGPPGPTRLAPRDFEEVGRLALRLRARHADLPHVAPLEHWLDEHFIGRLPRSGDARD
jgi:hypothetical protein